jgi:hypothetical protein
VIVQVCWDPGEQGTRDREVRAVAEAMEELDVREATVVTRLHREDVTLPQGTIRMVPAWEWLAR